MGGDKSFHSYKEVTGHSNAFVSRLRKDLDFENTWMMWLVADNLYRGAASNGLLIAEKIFEQLEN
jgi:aspartate-semialdehyde dehydrogenase